VSLVADADVDVVGAMTTAGDVATGATAAVVVVSGVETGDAVAADVATGVAATGEEDTAATTDELPEEEEVPKLVAAVVLAPETTETPLTVTTLPSVLVTLTSTVVVPKPAEFSKKLYVCLVVACHVLPPSVLTSRLLTALLAFTTCIENQYAETPSLLWSWRGVVIGQSMKSHVVWMIPGVASSWAKASGKRSRWLGPQPGHSSTTYNELLDVNYLRRNGQ
jgi:hypothetical protein